jgi:hypothetical protein
MDPLSGFDLPVRDALEKFTLEVLSLFSCFVMPTPRSRLITLGK